MRQKYLVITGVPAGIECDQADRALEPLKQKAEAGGVMAIRDYRQSLTQIVLIRGGRLEDAKKLARLGLALSDEETLNQMRARVNLDEISTTRLVGGMRKGIEALLR